MSNGNKLSLPANQSTSDESKENHLKKYTWFVFILDFARWHHLLTDDIT